MAIPSRTGGDPNPRGRRRSRGVAGPKSAECFEDLGRGPPGPGSRNLQNRRMLRGFAVVGGVRAARKARKRRTLRGSLKFGGATRGRISNCYTVSGVPRRPTRHPSQKPRNTGKLTPAREHSSASGRVAALDPSRSHANTHLPMRNREYFSASGPFLRIRGGSAASLSRVSGARRERVRGLSGACLGCVWRVPGACPGCVCGTYEACLGRVSSLSWACLGPGGASGLR